MRERSRRRPCSAPSNKKHGGGEAIRRGGTVSSSSSLSSSSPTASLSRSSFSTATLHHHRRKQPQQQRRKKAFLFDGGLQHFDQFSSNENSLRKIKGFVREGEGGEKKGEGGEEGEGGGGEEKEEALGGGGEKREEEEEGGGEGEKEEEVRGKCTSSRQKGLAGLRFAYGHDEYLYRFLVHNKTTIPAEGLAMIRYHSCYPWHTGGAYREFMNEDDEKMIEWVRLFNQYDLYTKADSSPDIKVLKRYYDVLIRKYLPGDEQGRLWW